MYNSNFAIMVDLLKRIGLLYMFVFWLHVIITCGSQEMLV